MSLAVVWLLPLRAYADRDNSDAAEVGHLLWLVGSFSIFFFAALALAIWLLVARLRSGPDSAPGVAPNYPSLEGVWARDRQQLEASSPAPVADAKEA